MSFDAAGRYAGFDSTSPLARRGGKAEVARNLVGAGGRPAVMIGDGITDLEAACEVDLFIGYGGVEDRDAVRKSSPVFIRCESLAPILAICLSGGREEDALGFARRRGAPSEGGVAGGAGSSASGARAEPARRLLESVVPQGAALHPRRHDDRR